MADRINRYQYTAEIVKKFYLIFPELLQYKDQTHFIFAGASTGVEFEKIPNKSLKGEINFQAANGKTHLVLLNLDESVFSCGIDKIHSILHKLKIPPSRIIYACSSFDADTAYEEYARKKGFKDRIQIIKSNVFEDCVTPRPELDFQIKKRNKKFLCFNRMGREHRFMLLARMIKHDLIDKAYYSFAEPVDYDFVKDLPLSEDDKRSILDSGIKFPLTLNIDFKTNAVDVSDDDLVYIEDSYFSVVTETIYFHADDERNTRTKVNAIFLSEKTFKPISTKHPFIIVGQPQSLKLLRDLGYKTFSPYFNEDYDNIRDDDLRMDSIVSEIVRLSNLSDNQWIELQAKIKSIVEHNCRLYAYKSNNRSPAEYRFTQNVTHLFEDNKKGP